MRPECLLAGKVLQGNLLGIRSLNIPAVNKGTDRNLPTIRKNVLKYLIICLLIRGHDCFRSILTNKLVVSPEQLGRLKSSLKKTRGNLGSHL